MGSVVEGDPFGELKETDDKDSSAKEVNEFHKKSDVDSRPFAQHHTLGTGRNQASPGDHNHDGKTSRKVGHGLGLVVTGSKGGNAAIASLLSALSQVIEFTDSTT